MASNDSMIAALLRERDGYERRGLDERVRQVDEQLEHYGHSPAAREADGPQGRTAPPQQTADRPKKAPAKRAAKKTTAAPAPEPQASGEAQDESPAESAPAPSAE